MDGTCPHEIARGCIIFLVGVPHVLNVHFYNLAQDRDFSPQLHLSVEVEYSMLGTVAAKLKHM